LKMLRLICYVSKATREGAEAMAWVTTGETRALYCGDGKENAGQGMAKMPRSYKCNREMTESSSRGEGRGREGKGSSDACPLGDAAQSVTHLDVLARVVAS
jgi:hypothetical protein